MKRNIFYTDDRFDRRLPLKMNLKETYVNLNKNFYEKITEEELYIALFNFINLFPFILILVYN